MTEEQAIRKLPEPEVDLSPGRTVGQLCKRLRATKRTYDRRRKAYAGLCLDRPKQLKERERVDARLKKLVADLSLDNVILTEAASANF